MWAYAMPVYVLFVSRRSDIVFNLSAGAITDHIQSAKDIDPYFKSQFYVKDPGHRKPVLIYRMGWVNPKSERTTEIKCTPCVRFEPTISWSTVQHVTTELSLLPILHDNYLTVLSLQAAAGWMFCWNGVSFWKFIFKYNVKHDTSEFDNKNVNYYDHSNLWVIMILGRTLIAKTQ